MARNNAHQLVILKRRAQVAALRLRGFSQRDICVALATSDSPNVNPEDGKPWSLGTINHDLKVIEAEWRARLEAKIDEHRAKQLAEIDEVDRSAWRNQNYEIVLKCAQQRRDLLGLDAPRTVKTELTGKDGGPIETTPPPASLDLSRLSYDELKSLESIHLKLRAAGPSGGPEGAGKA